MVKRRSTPHQSRPKTPAPRRFNLGFILAIGLALPITGLLLYHIFPGSHLSTTASTSTFPEELNTMSSSLRRAAPLVFPAVSRHTATVIFVHGLGDSGAGWADAVEQWRARQRLNGVKFILPNAPNVPITLNHGMQMPGWFDIKSLGGSASEEFAHDEDTQGILTSQAYFHGMIQSEIDGGIPADRIVIGGFSQGGAMSIFSALTAPVKLAGVVGLSSWLLLNSTFKDRIPQGDFNKATPIFMGHGDSDPMVRYELAVATEEKLKQLGYDVTLNTYRGMAHSACLDELNQVETFLKTALPHKE